MARNKNIFKENMTFDYTELTALCEHLKIRELEGKRLKEIDKYNLIYDNCESRDIRYSAVIFSNILMHSDFIASCEQEGWEYVTSHNELYIFRTQNSDATKIITDEKENFRAVTKAFLRNPRFLGFSFTSFYCLFKLFTYYFKQNILWIKAPLSADSDWFYWCFFTVLCFTLIFIQTEEYIEWYFKTKKALKNGDDIPFFNLKQRKIKLTIRKIMIYMWTATWLFIFVMIINGYVIEYEWVFWVFAFMIILIDVFYILENIKGKSKLKSPFILILETVIIITATFGLNTLLETSYNKNPYIIRENSMPLTVADFNCCENECTLENEIDVYKGTRLAQFYYITSHCPDHSKAIQYTVFVSNYPAIRKNYVEALKKENHLTPVHNSENSQWDELYKITGNDGEVTKYGFAVKGNTVVYLTDNLYYDLDADFFDVAYSKLFG